MVNDGEMHVNSSVDITAEKQPGLRSLKMYSEIILVMSVTIRIIRTTIRLLKIAVIIYILHKKL